MTNEKKEKLKKIFCDIVNKEGIDNTENIPDYILAKYLVECIENIGIAKYLIDKHESDESK